MADHRSKTESSPAGRPGTAAPQQLTLQGGRFRGSSARAVGIFVPRLTQKAMQKYGFSTAALLTDWSAIVGQDLARYTSPQRLKWPRMSGTGGDGEAEQVGRPGATLHLNVDAARALDVQYKGRQIVERINSYFGYRAVADLRIQQVPIAALPGPKPRDVVAAKPRESRPGPDLGQIADERLRAALERLERAIAKR